MTRIITLCGASQARKGFKFLAMKPSERCVGCRLYRVCVGKLEPLRLYRIVEVRDRFFPCTMHEGGVRLVVVEESPIEAAVIDRFLVEGMTLTFKPINCEARCIYRSLCSPDGLRKGEKCRIVKVYERLDCLGGLKLRRVALKRVTSQPL